MTPDLIIHVTAQCPVCEGADRVVVDCEVDPDGWRCPRCKTTWTHKGYPDQPPPLEAKADPDSTSLSLRGTNDDK